MVCLAVPEWATAATCLGVTLIESAAHSDPVGYCFALGTEMYLMSR